MTDMNNIYDPFKLWGFDPYAAGYSREDMNAAMGSYSQLALAQLSSITNMQNNIGREQPPAKRKPNPVPDEQKDDTYYERRKKNNDSARRSREARRQKEQQNAMSIEHLRDENQRLREHIQRLQFELLKYQGMYYNKS